MAFCVFSLSIVGHDSVILTEHGPLSRIREETHVFNVKQAGYFGLAHNHRVVVALPLITPRRYDRYRSCLFQKTKGRGVSVEPGPESDATSAWIKTSELVFHKSVLFLCFFLHFFPSRISFSALSGVYKIWGH